MKNEQMKIWGTSYGVLGDLVMGLPLLEYFEKKFPGSYKYWVIQGKCAISAQLYLNHPLIDRIKITDEYSAFGEEDRRLMGECSYICPDTARHDRADWYNERTCIEETARLAGVLDLNEVLTPEETHPKLYKWFTPGLANPRLNTYSKINEMDLSQFKKNIAIWPFASQAIPGRSPSPQWWNILIDNLTNIGYTVYHYGRSEEPLLSNSPNYQALTSLSFFQQIKASLASQVVIGPDTGPMWVMGGYRHPAINLATNYLPNHHPSNILNMVPVNDNATTIFSPYNQGVGCDGINIGKVIEIVVDITGQM